MNRILSEPRPITRDDAGLVELVWEEFESVDGITAVGYGSTSYTYADGRINEVVYSGAHSFLPNVKLDYRASDAAGRPTGYDIFDGSTPRLDVAYGYDAQGRVGSVASSIHGSFTYGYHPGSGIVSGYVGSVGGTPVFGFFRTVDSHGRIASVSNKNGAGQVLASVGYSYDRGDRRTQARREDGSYWNYGYNTRGEVNASTRHKADNTSINGLESRYGYDEMGNRNWAKFGGGETGGLTQIDYTVDALNQYSLIDHPGKFWIVGRAPAFDPVQVNSSLAGKQGDWFSKEVLVSNASNPVNFPLVVEDNASNEISSGNVAIPKASISPTYDHAGNLINDGRWVYEWDSVNRLRKMTTTSEAVSGGFPDQLIEFVYDWRDRRIAKKVTEGINVRHTRYLYEEWNVVAEWTLHGSSTTLLTPQTNLWGLDLAGQNSGSASQIQAAGGVGGLLAVDVRKISDASSLGRLYASYDGNGNILDWSGADGLIKRSQDYDAFGNLVLRNTDAGGPLALGQGEVGYGFSTKPIEKESGLMYYGYRYYDPVIGRWLNRDPIEEKGGFNLYGFVANQPINHIDVLGLARAKVVVNYSPPDASKIVPEISDTGSSGTTYHDAKVVCFCVCPGRNGKDSFMTCRVSFSAKITVSRDQATRQKVTVSGIYGHEQLHVRSRTERVRGVVVNPLGKKTGEFNTLNACESSKKKYEKEFQKLLDRELDPRAGFSDHDDDPNTLAPGEGVPYDPLPGSPPIQ